MTKKPLDYTLHDYTQLVVQHFLQALAQPPVNLYDFVIGQVESALIQQILQYSNGNLSKSAQYLGINRATLRKKIKALHLTTSMATE